MLWYGWLCDFFGGFSVKYSIFDYAAFGQCLLRGSSTFINEIVEEKDNFLFDENQENDDQIPDPDEPFYKWAWAEIFDVSGYLDKLSQTSASSLSLIRYIWSQNAATRFQA